MKVADIQLYMNDLGDNEVVYTAVMDGYVGTGDSPQGALSNLPEVEEMSLSHHFLCEDDMTLRDFVEINGGDKTEGKEPYEYRLSLHDHFGIRGWSFCLEICASLQTTDHKWTIAYWVKEKEGYSLKFSSSRPLDYRINSSKLMNLIKEGQAIADKRFQEENDEH